MTTFTISVEGDDTPQVFRNLVSTLSPELDVEQISVEIGFDGFSMSARGESVRDVATRLNHVDFDDDPTSITLDATVVAVPDATTDSLAERGDCGDDSADADATVTDDPWESGQSAITTDTKTQEMRANTMEHVALDVLYRKHLSDQQTAPVALDADIEYRVLDADLDGVSVSRVGAVFDLPDSRIDPISNALRRAASKEKAERKRAPAGNGYVYRITRDGIAELMRMGEPSTTSREKYLATTIGE